jgi:BMFP domain-containing protein YqiC
VARLRTSVERAAALHQHAAALVTVADRALARYSPAAAPADQYAEQYVLAARLRAAAAVLVPGWLGATLDAMAPSTPLGGSLVPTYVSVGQAHPLDDARFPVVVPLLGVGHLAVDADVRDPRAAALIRAVLLRLLATAPPRSLLVRAIDAAGTGTTLDVFHGIEEVLPRPEVSRDGLRTVLTEAEEWATTNAARPAPAIASTAAGYAEPPESPADRTADLSPPRHLVVLIASLPELTEGADLIRIAALAKNGPAARVHLVVAGWPPPPLTADTTQPPLPHCTHITLRNPYAWIGNPPGQSFAAQRGPGIMPGRLNAPVYLDSDPPADLVRTACDQLAAELVAPTGRPIATPGPELALAWRDYLAASQRLDVVRREAAAVVTSQTTALRAARDDLTAVRARLGTYHERLAEIAYEADAILPAQPIELPPAEPTPAAASAAIRAAHETLNNADQLLSTLESSDDRRPYLRNGAVYGSFALVAATIQVLVFLLASETSIVTMAAIPCGLVLPFVAFVMGWLTIALFRPGPGEDKVDHTSAFGAWVSALAAAPLIAMIVYVAASAV